MKKGITDTLVIWHKMIIITDASQILFIISEEADHHTASYHSKQSAGLHVENKAADPPHVQPEQVQEMDTLFGFKISLKTCIEML